MQDKPSGFQSRGWITRAMNGGNPVTYKGITYRSHRALALKLGIPIARINKALDRDGHLDNLDTGPRRNPGTVSPCRFRDVDYPSQKALAEAVGVSPAAVCKHLQKYGHLENLLAPKPDTSVTYGGVTYPTITALSKATGISRGTIRRHKVRYGHLDFLGKIPGAHPPKRVNVGGLSFPSRAAAARALGIGRSAMHRFANHQSTEHEADRIHAAARDYAERALVRGDEK